MRLLARGLLLILLSPIILFVLSLLLCLFLFMALAQFAFGDNEKNYP